MGPYLRWVLGHHTFCHGLGPALNKHTHKEDTRWSTDTRPWNMRLAFVATHNNRWGIKGAKNIMTKSMTNPHILACFVNESPKSSMQVCESDGQPKGASGSDPYITRGIEWFVTS